MPGPSPQGTPPGDPAIAPALRTRRVELRPVLSTDMDWLYALLTFEAGSRWRYRGRTPGHAEFANDLWHGVHTQYVVCTPTAQPVGVVGTYNVNHSAGHCHLFAVASPDHGAEVTEGTGLLIDWAFTTFDLHKIWVEAPEFNLAQFAGLTRVAEVEGRLRDYEFWQGRFWDVLILSIGRRRWSEVMGPVVERRRADAAAAAVGVPDPEPGAASGDRPAPAPGAGGGFPKVAAVGDVDPLGGTAVADLLGSVWPLDSVGAVELTARLEERLGHELPPDLLDGLEVLPLEEAAVVLAGRLGRPRGPVAGEDLSRSPGP